MKKIALVSYHYSKTQTRGGEIHVKKIANLLKKHHKITILTTQSKDHLTWKSELSEYEKDNQIEIVRFPTDFTVIPKKITNLAHLILKNKNKTTNDEINYFKSIGPYSTSLFNFLKNNKNNFDLFIFTGYANPITFFGLPIVKNKSLLIPLVHKEPQLYFSIFDNFFNLPKLILASSVAEKEIIEKRFPNHSLIKLLGIHPEEDLNITKSDSCFFLKKHKIINPYIIFIGRIEPYKGIFQLIKFYKKYLNKHDVKIDLLIIGEKLFSIEKNPYIKYLGVITDEEKFFLLKNSLFLINPSWYESLSLTLLEAWQQKKPVLVYGLNPVLKDQVLRSKGGLYYETYQEFEEKVRLLLKDEKLRKSLGNNGYLFYKNNYSETVIEKKLKSIIDKFF